MFREFDIDQLRKDHPLPKGGKDIVVNREDLADALNKSTVMIDKYRKGGMPVLSEGGSGKSYEFQLHDCWAWYHGYKASEITIKSEKQSQLDLLRQALHGDDFDSDVIELTPQQRKQEYEAQQQYAAAAIAQGQLVKSAEMTLLLESVFGVLRQQLLGLPDIMERRVGLSPEQAAVMEQVSKESISSIHQVLRGSNLALLRDEKLKVKAAR